ncbi:hypothetical protein HDV06_001660 [Boothiomyces sp. JEL0866]|nr:hypothetical protein HDV06_001660 [Boothiomyces sp. JEL0866]
MLLFFTFLAAVLADSHKDIQICETTCVTVIIQQQANCNASTDPNGCILGTTVAQNECKGQCQNGTKKRKRDMRSGMRTRDLERLHQNLHRRDGCWFSARFNRDVCLVAEDMVQLGSAVSNSCTADNQGQQLCAGDKGFVTCDNNNWTIEQYCGTGTRCQPHPTDPDNHVICGSA